MKRYFSRSDGSPANFLPQFAVLAVAVWLGLLTLTPAFAGLSGTPMAPSLLSLPIPRSYLAVSTNTSGNGGNGDTILAIGGSGIVPTDVVEGYLASADRWETKASLPASREGLAAADLAGRVFAVGGREAEAVTGRVDAYNPGGNSWTVVASLNTPREGHGLAALGGKLYAAGGFDGTDFLASLEVYDPNTNAWINRAAMPTARTRLALVALGDRLYAIGGWNGAALATVEVYNPTTNSWSAGVNLPSPRHSLAGAAFGSTVLAIGGYNDQEGVLALVDSYLPGDSVWRSAGSLSQARFGHGAVALAGGVYVVGGTSGAANVGLVERIGQAPTPRATPTQMPLTSEKIRLPIIQCDTCRP